MGVTERGIRDIYERNHVGFTGKFNAMQICNGGTSAKVAELKLKVKVNKILYLHSNCVTEVDRSLQLYDGTLNFLFYYGSGRQCRRLLNFSILQQFFSFLLTQCEIK